jgi:hypothetical protein
MLNTKALAASVSAPPAVYIEDVFSTWLYTGNGSTQTITNGIDLAGEGGMVWIKCRNAADVHCVYDTQRGGEWRLGTSLTIAQNNSTDQVSFQSTGFTAGVNSAGNTNTSGNIYASWTFRKAEKFFDVVTYTGTGSNRTVAHNLGSVPGCIIVKRTDTTGDWQVYHRSNTANPETDYLVLNSNAATADSNTRWNDTLPTSTVFSLGTEATVNASGGTYVAYLFAHDAGGFGDSGSESAVSCGSYTGNGSATGPVIDLGWEPQWLLIKNTSGTGSWVMVDAMRGFVVGGNDAIVYAQLANAEVLDTWATPTATGFQIITANGNLNDNGSTYIYIAIRRGPMKTPTDATKVFAADIGNNTGSSLRAFDSGFPVDLLLRTRRADGANITPSRITGGKFLRTYSTNAEAGPLGEKFDDMGGVGYSSSIDFTDWIGWMFRRAPGFFDVVAYTGDGAAFRDITHGLAAAPDFIIIKSRSASGNWAVWHRNNGTSAATFFDLNGTSAANVSSSWIGFATSTIFKAGLNQIAPSLGTCNTSGTTYIAYLFATLAGVSKVGSYTGTGATLDVDCGFTAGARFVLIKRTDSTGDWFVWDTARGIVSGDDPYLLLNSTAAEVTNTDYIDPLSSGFQISSTAPAAINASGGSFIFLAIA